MSAASERTHVADGVKSQGQGDAASKKETVSVTQEDIYDHIAEPHQFLSGYEIEIPPPNVAIDCHAQSSKEMTTFPRF